MTAYLDGVVGHERPLAFLSGIERTGRIPPGLLFHGPAGVGKHTTARAWLRRLDCENGTGCGACGSCARHDGGNVPDLELVGVEEGKSLVSIDQLRRLREWFSLAPYQAARRTAIIDDAHRMTEEAQNSLLKLLEEPPRDGLLVLVTCEPARLLETVVSRVQPIYFAGLADEDVLRVLEREGPGGGASALELAHGSPGTALALSDRADDLAARARELLDRRVGPFTFAEAVCGKSRGQALRDHASSVIAAAIDLAARDLAEAAGAGGAERLERVVGLLIDADAAVRGNVSPRLLFESTKILVNRALAG